MSKQKLGGNPFWIVSLSGSLFLLSSTIVGFLIVAPWKGSEAGEEFRLIWGFWVILVNTMLSPALLIFFGIVLQNGLANKKVLLIGLSSLLGVHILTYLLEANFVVIGILEIGFIVGSIYLLREYEKANANHT